MKHLKLVFTYFFLTFFIFFVLYFFISNILLLIPSAKNNTSPKNSTIYIYHNIAHTEIILKTKDLEKPFLKTFQNNIDNIQNGFLAFSYGDQNFMLHTPQWKDIKLKPTLYALFFNTPAIIQVGHYSCIKQDSSVIRVKITKQSYLKIQKAILNSLVFTHEHPKLIAQKNHLYYFKAQTPYNMFYTCNTWTGNILNSANLSVSCWTPLSYQVVYGFL